MNGYVRDAFTYLLNPPSVRATETAGTSAANNANVVVPWGGESWDTTGDMHNTSSQTSRIVAPDPGIYVVTVFVRWVTNATGIRTINLRMNAGGNPAGGTTLLSANAGALSGVQTPHIVSRQIVMDPGDYVETFISQSSGGTLALDAGASFCEMYWMRNKP
ncbi:hypothetical protein [Actinomadura sp. NEAU-AAG7]|uniref:hypothetical protein n=1 Tax=Actinomadura sp. NEAU-AAG7 TaxID=2839640 RepID=UPI001BE400B2|nr:hypothetical protein [Actinomadura sp. NEAU-AAG7]MBT2213454.1 hypothetical protein [Actinomadura sp. NEAU-AAG7]